MENNIDYQKKLSEYIEGKYDLANATSKQTYDNKRIRVWACKYRDLALNSYELPFEYGFYLKEQNIKYDISRESLLIFYNYEGKLNGQPWFSYSSEISYQDGKSLSCFIPLWKEYEAILSEEDRNRLKSDNLFREIYTLLQACEPWNF